MLQRKKPRRICWKQLHKGKIMFQLHGEKLKGAFALVKSSSYQGENSWLLMKAKDNMPKKQISPKRKVGTVGQVVVADRKDPERIYGQKTIKTRQQQQKAAAKKPGNQSRHS